ncbi:50S ribosomal protein [Musa troglodytarum]|uniref:50S ribosomal protein n=1 Tax=Musa troglodytarum TaxID=320322 RepID=A0A9E7JC60_9LILI|nr:50S ribosomal protein [Musa troglodytarum]
MSSWFVPAGTSLPSSRSPISPRNQEGRRFQLLFSVSTMMEHTNQTCPMGHSTCTRSNMVPAMPVFVEIKMSTKISSEKFQLRVGRAALLVELPIVFLYPMPSENSSGGPSFHQSPNKINLAAWLVHGMHVKDVLLQLQVTIKRAAETVIHSSRANAAHNYGSNPDRLLVENHAVLVVFLLVDYSAARRASLSWEKGVYEVTFIPCKRNSQGAKGSSRRGSKDCQAPSQQETHKAQEAAPAPEEESSSKSAISRNSQGARGSFFHISSIEITPRWDRKGMDAAPVDTLTHLGF